MNNNKNLLYEFHSYLKNKNFKSDDELKTIKKELQQYKNFEQHNQVIKSILYGSMLGDGHANKPSPKHNTRIQFGFGEKNSQYAIWFHRFLSLSGLSTPILNLDKKCLDSRNSQYYLKISFQTYRFKSFNDLHSLFYRLPTDCEINNYNLKNKKLPNFIKIVPENIEMVMDPLVLSIWFQDDGSFSKKDKYLKFATNGFSEKDVILLKEALKNKFNLNSNLHFADKHSVTNENQYTLYIPKGETVKFIEIVEPYIIPSMRYKLGF